MSTQTIQTLNTGATVPALGFGTWQDKEEQENAVVEALKAGYRHIDTAHIYGTETAVGSAIKISGVDRKSLFITTKLWNNAHAPEDVEPALDDSLKALGTDYVDLYLMHWPAAFKPGAELMPKDANGKLERAEIDYVDTWKAMEKLLKTGKTKAIGVCNFNKSELERILKEGTVVPAMHQVEMHPWLQQKEFAEWHKAKGIHMTQYSPFGNLNPTYVSGKELGRLTDEPVLQEIGKKYGKSGAQVALAWGIAHGRCVVPKSKTPARIKDNLQSDFKLEMEDVKKIDGLDKKLRFNDPSAMYGYAFHTGLDGKK